MASVQWPVVSVKRKDSWRQKETDATCSQPLFRLRPPLDCCPLITGHRSLDTAPEMDTALLLNWLGLPPGPWPPEDRALLSLPAAPTVVSAVDAEQQALARMEKLRPHQLKHPELVTEGMNRLAQALIGMMATAPAIDIAAAAPPPKPRRPAKPRPKPKLEPLPPPAIDFAPVAAPPPPPPTVAVVLDAEVILDAEAVSPRRPANAPPAPRPVLPVPPVSVPEPPEGTNYFPTDRRKGYRELVFLRRLRAAWGLLKSTLGDANEPLTSAEAVYELLSGARDLAVLRQREEFDRVVRGDAESVAAVAVQPAVLAVLRELVPSQRWGLAVSWDAGRIAIERREKWLRERMRESKPPRRMRSGDGDLGEFLRANPEWVLVVLTAVAVVVGVLRAVGRNAG